MTFKKGKQKFAKEEIIDILKRNVNLFRDEEEFVQYIVDLAMYLVEHRLQTQTEAGDRTYSPFATPVGIEKRQEQFKRTRGRDEELLQVLKKHSTRHDAVLHCRMCGSQVVGRATCPNCGNMTF